VDCVVSGDPCQPNSVAGRGLGADDDRWLLDRVIDTFDRSRAARLFRENVPGNADGQLGVLVPALEGLGCRVAVGLFSAKELGFAHGRERLFVMADRADIGHQWARSARRRRNGPANGGGDMGDTIGAAIRALSASPPEVVEQ
jgi:DNA (cytosine-5)-methyltransferase 1